MANQDQEQSYSFEEYLNRFVNPNIRSLIRNAYENSLNKLLSDGDFPIFIRYIGTTPNEGSSKHKAVSKFVEQAFTIFKGEVQKVKETFKTTFTEHDELDFTRAESYRRHMHSISESHIDEFVERVVWDVLVLMGYADEYFVASEWSDQAIGRKDIWVVRAADASPMFIVKVVTSSNSEILSDNCVLGQGFDLITHISASSGRRVLFCVLTTYDHWRIVWLPDTDTCTASNEQWDLATQSVPLPALNAADVLARELHGSRIYALNDVELLPALMTAMWKTVHSHLPLKPVKLIEPDRMYIQSDKHMATLSALPSSLLTPTAQYPNFLTQRFYFIRDYRGGIDGRVWLAGTESGSLVFLKFHYDHQVREKEEKLWKFLYDFDLFSVPLYPRESVALVLPVAIHCEQREEGGTMEFNVNITAWTSGHELVRRSDRLMATDIVNWSEVPLHPDFAGLSPADVLQQACEKLLAKKKVHLDLAWRHVALLPRYEDNVCVAMEPILLDLSAVEDLTEENEAEFRAAIAQLLSTTFPRVTKES